MTERRQVFVVDDDDAVRDSLAFLLKSSGYQVDAYASAIEAMAGMMTAASGCVVTDVRMPGMSGVDLLRELRARPHPLPVIVITGHGDVALAVEAMKAGAADFIEKPFTADRIMTAVAAALDRAANTEGPEAAEQVHQRVAGLTQREQEIMALLVTGHSNKSAARELSISPRTVEVHRARVMQKMEAKNLAELVRMSVLINR